MAKAFKVIVLGDVVGQAGCRAVLLALPRLVREHGADMAVVNGENAADGFGITPEIAGQIFAAGANVITTGNHVWQQRSILPFLDSEERILRAHNYPKGVAGHGSCRLSVRGTPVAVVSLQGRVRMTDLTCPFAAGRELVKKLRQDTRIILVDFHAEDAEEKEALGLHLDGLVSAVFGTHTHVQTADERILPQGSAYIGDIGMVGPSGSVIGFRVDIAVERALSQMPLKMEVSDAPAEVNGIRIDIDPESGKALAIERIKARSLV